MSNYTKNNIGSGYNTTTSLNAELEKVETAVNSKLDKTGGSVSGDVSLESNDLLNVSHTYTGGLTLNGEVITGVSDLGVVTFPALSSVTYTNSGTGAVGRGLQSKLDDVVSVKDFGAVGDGVTDDTAAIQSAFDSGASFVIFPQGTFRIASPGITISSNTRVSCEGKIVITSAILAASYVGAIRIDTRSEVHWRGGEIDVSGFPSYDNTIIDVRDSTDCSFKDIRIKDSGANRYPLGVFRSLRNTRVRYSDIHCTNIGDGFMQCIDDTYCHYTFLTMIGGSHTGLDTTRGEHNVIMGNITECTSNTLYSGLSFNDKWSVCSGNVVEGGAYNITGGHSGTPVDHSTIVGNACDSASTHGIQLQYSTNATVIGNAVDGTATYGLFSDSNSKFNTFIGNTVDGTWTTGARIGSHSIGVGNIATGASTGFRNARDNVPALYVANIAGNGTGVGFDWGVASSQAENVVVGNLAVDDQGTATQTYGFRSLSGSNLFLGNATDGNHTTAEFSGTFSTSVSKNTSDTTALYGITSDGDTGGTGSAGAGNQYIEIDVNGTTYRVLHDGTV
jgi:hypothetical protein